MPIITDRKIGYEFKDRNLEFLNQPAFIFHSLLKLNCQSQNEKTKNTTLTMI
jgi:hypothetical protein